MEEIQARNPKEAAVNILLYKKEDEWHLPLMVRSKNERDRHSGQISLPGGKRESYDPDFAHTALRETHEELGIDTKRIELLRELSPVYIPPSNFFVYAFVSVTHSDPLFKLQQGEAEELIEMPLQLLLDLPEPPQTLELPQTQGVAVPVIPFGDYIVWGATAMVLSEFSYLLKKV